MTRLEKYSIFKQFFDTSKETFKEINDSYKPHLELRKSYDFYVAPGSCMGGQDITVVEALYGNRPYRQSKKIISMQITTEIEAAYGTRLHYYQIDTGNVLVFLYPAYTEKHRPQEQCIIIDYFKDPKKLLNKKYLTKHL